MDRSANTVWGAVALAMGVFLGLLQLASAAILPDSMEKPGPGPMKGTIGIICVSNEGKPVAWYKPGKMLRNGLTEYEACLQGVVESWDQQEKLMSSSWESGERTRYEALDRDPLEFLHGAGTYKRVLNQNGRGR